MPSDAKGRSCRLDQGPLDRRVAIAPGRPEGRQYMRQTTSPSNIVVCRYRVSLKSEISSRLDEPNQSRRNYADDDDHCDQDEKLPREGAVVFFGRIGCDGLWRLVRVLIHAPIMADRSCKSHEGHVVEKKELTRGQPRPEVDRQRPPTSVCPNVADAPVTSTCGGLVTFATVNCAMTTRTAGRDKRRCCPCRQAVASAAQGHCEEGRGEALGRRPAIVVVGDVANQVAVDRGAASSVAQSRSTTQTKTHRPSDRAAHSSPTVFLCCPAFAWASVEFLYSTIFVRPSRNSTMTTATTG